MSADETDAVSPDSDHVEDVTNINKNGVQTDLKGKRSSSHSSSSGRKINCENDSIAPSCQSVSEAGVPSEEKSTDEDSHLMETSEEMLKNEEKVVIRATDDDKPTMQMKIESARNESSNVECVLNKENESEHDGKRTGSLIGKIKIKPFLSLADQAPPLLINQRPQEMLARPFRYYVTGFNSPLIAAPMLSAFNSTSCFGDKNLQLQQSKTSISNLNFPSPLSRAGNPDESTNVSSTRRHPSSSQNGLIPSTSFVKVEDCDSKKDLPTTLSNNQLIKTELDLPPDIEVGACKLDLVPGSNVDLAEAPEEREINFTDSTRETFIKKSKDFFKGDGISKYNPDGKFKCQFCHFAVKSKEYLLPHSRKYHCRENKFKCLICSVKNNRSLEHSSLNELSHHVAKVHFKEKRWVCRVCFKSFKSALSRDAHHRKICSTKDPFACHLCTFTCQTENALNLHLQKHVSKPKEKVVCPLCSKKFTPSSLTSHMSMHKEPYVCDVCDKKYLSMAQLKTHHAITNHHKPFRCGKCRFGCSDEQILQKHTSTSHPLKRTYSCLVPTCLKAFDSEHLLNLHKKLHEVPEDQWLRCPATDCDLVTLSKVTMKVHLRKTNHRRNFPCPDCSLRFAKEVSLAHHIQTIHVPQLLKQRENSMKTLCTKSCTNDDLSFTISHLSEEIEEDPVANFARSWLGISGLGVDGVVHTDQNEPNDNCSQVTTERNDCVDDEHDAGMETVIDGRDEASLGAVIPLVTIVEVKEETP